MCSLVKPNHCHRRVLFFSLLLFSLSSLAEGILDIKPYISTNVTYDDNVFRFTSPEEAKAAFGSSATSDVEKRLDLGVDVKLRLSRQLLTLTTSVNETTYNRFTILDNTGRSTKLNWAWRIGNDVYGELSTSESQSIAGFTEIRDPVKNLVTYTRQHASVNWNLQPSWTLQATTEVAQEENAVSSFKSADRKDDIYDVGIHYQNPLGTQLGIDYQVTNSSFPDRNGSELLFFGNESSDKEIITTGAWLPTHETKISAHLSLVSLGYKDLPQRNFNGFGQRWNLDHSFSGKTSINLTAYQEISPIDDVVSTYVKTKGFSINPMLKCSSKISLKAGLGYEARDYLGSAGYFTSQSNNRYDESTLANLSLVYTPTYKTLVQIQYQGEKRNSNIANLGYQFNMINFLFRYDY